ncbi:sulfatase [Aquihabitans sp. G128]|uniref:sulfatase family protein n=1 Tax=Aquihabitans sp. G128 TaxID=2849779 RepID=UPI001C2445DB|nr:sulfatase [Aquihabitans sp. G128]QXC59383.1 sulfatase [Aquihabitans sp. G128]
MAPDPTADAPARRPNVVLINCDDLGYGDLGCYGSTRNQTPALDALAAEGLRFDSFYMASPVCSPSRGALLTGCYPPRIGFGSFDGLPVLFPGQGLGLPPSEISLGALLGSAGYRTQMIGKWHCGDQPAFLPTNHGFDHYLGLPYSNDMGRQAPMAEGPFAPPPGAEPRYLPPLPLLLDHDVIEQQPDQASLTERYVTEAVRFLRDCGDDPFFLYLAHLYVHVPIYVQERFARQSANGPYGAAVASIDWATAVLVHELRSLGLEDDTIVIFTSDNGSRGIDGGSNQPLRGAKTTTWEGGMRVPCIVRWPGHVAPGRTTDEVATAMDLYPTLAAACGATLPDDRTIDGCDITALLEDPEATSPHEAFLYYWMDDLEAVRVGRWKLHLAKHGSVRRELYDLEEDPGEAHDVLAAHPDVEAAIEVHVEAARRSLGDARTGRAGEDRRPVGRVPDPVPLTTYDPEHPYYLAEYDLTDRG